MENLRIVGLSVIDSSNIEVYFSHKLSKYLSLSNFSIVSESGDVEDPTILSFFVNNTSISIECQPLTALYSYYFIAKSTQDFPFFSANDTAKLSEDSISNKYFFTGIIGKDNPVKSYLKSYLSGSIYDTSDENSVISKHVDSLSKIFSTALYDIGQTKNENYLTFTVDNEQKIRGESGFDRLNEESAYEILRVGRTPSSNKSNATIQNTFNDLPLSLQADAASDLLSVDYENSVGSFNPNNLILNLRNDPLSKVIKIVFLMNNVSVSYQYDIDKLGYQSMNSRYDQNRSFDNAMLKANQIKLSDIVLNDPAFSISDIINIRVDYEYINLGRIVDIETIKIFSSIVVNREALPSLINVFNFKHAPLISGNNQIAKLNAISFNNLNASNPNQPHPAFLNEIEFRLNALPFLPGQYAIDYASGTAYVYGENASNSGTGDSPPTANYRYELSHKENLDYTIDDQNYDISSLKYGNLLGTSAFISFEYEQALIPNKDYKSTLHKEEMTERGENRLVALNAIKVKNSPITNAFKIFNETSGEIYTIDRWNDDTIYFRYINPPEIVSKKNERVSFNQIANEKLFVNNVLVNSGSKNIVEVILKNDRIVSATEDCIASFFNTSATFSDTLLFATEKYFDASQSAQANINTIVNAGEYIVNYFSGTVYVYTGNPAISELGLITYKNSQINTLENHVLSVDNLYYQINPLDSNNKKFNYSSFDDSSIDIQSLDLADEKTLNDDIIFPYQTFGGRLGVFSDGNFTNATSNEVKFIRSIFEIEDLKNSSNPLNFSDGATKDLAVPSINNVFYTNVYALGGDFYINLNRDIGYISGNISYSFQVERISDSLPLWDISGAVIPGSPLKLKLSGLNSPQDLDNVKVSYQIAINDLSRIMVDYNKGELYADYTYLNDEIIASYEYGDNEIDFRKSTSILKDDTYYVSYKVGALREALYSNFGNMLNITELSDFDTDFNRERYRDTLTAALTSFLKGPTVAAIKNIGKNISHIEPRIKESLFSGWSLGSSLLSPKQVKSMGNFETLPGRYRNGVLINDKSQSITLNSNSNLKLEEGSFECNVIPHWNGIDNQSDLIIEILKNGAAISSSEVFVGSAEDHPTLVLNKFLINKKLVNYGSPNLNKDGVFIYYDKDTSGNFDRWYIQVIDGYVAAQAPSYKIKISSPDGKFYDAKSLFGSPPNLQMTTGTKSLTLQILAVAPIDYKITFISNADNYLFDYGQDDKNRMSLFKDASGYLTFKIVDKNKKSYALSADISSWKENDLHHVACSWKINSKNKRDEIHLFVDGMEVPNIIKYNQKLHPYLHQKFRTINREEILDVLNKDILSSSDLKTTLGSNQVSSAINFSAYNISPGDLLYVNELGFDPMGYSISSIAGQTITLSTSMPLSIDDCKFTINKTDVIVNSNIDIVSKFSLSRFKSTLDGYSLSTVAASNTVISSINFSLANVVPGDLFKINNSAFEDVYTILNVSGTSLFLNKAMPTSLSGLSFNIYSPDDEVELPGIKSVIPSYSMRRQADTNILTILNGVFKEDLLLIKTYGLNYQKVKSNYYIWSDGYENILKTKLPAPISLNEMSIKKVLLNSTNISPSNSVVAGGLFTKNGIIMDNPTDSTLGRTLEIIIGGTNTDFSTPTQIAISGMKNATPISETLSFSMYGSKNSVNKYTSINYINVITKPTSTVKPSLTVKVREKYNTTFTEDGYAGAQIQYAYQVATGYNLEKAAADTVRDNTNLFSSYNNNNYLFINSPPSVAGYYLIDEVSVDRKSMRITPTNAAASIPIPSFTGGQYQVLTVSNERSGFQNGFVIFQQKLSPGMPYFLNKGLYEIEYFTYLNIDFDKVKLDIYFGSSNKADAQLNGVLDDVKIYSSAVSDTRVGEIVPDNSQSFTKSFNSIKEMPIADNMLVYLNFDDEPFTNNVNYFKINNEFQHSNNVINESFDDNVLIKNEPIIISNDGILNTSKEATIEFWTSPMYDTYNDPKQRFYFDASSAIEEDFISYDNSSIKMKSSVKQILSVRLAGENNGIDYFAGGKLELDNDRSIVEDRISINNFTIIMDVPIFQVISVKIDGDLSEKNYYVGGIVDGEKIVLGIPLPQSSANVIVTYRPFDTFKVVNKQVVRLGRKLPNNNSRVKISYVPNGNVGDRVSIYKDNAGYLNFGISASGTDYIVRAPIVWSQGSWHRVKASYKINGGKGADEMRLFIDGYQYTSVLYGSGIIYGSNPVAYGSTNVGDGYTLQANIKFKDTINTLYIGSDYKKANTVYSILDNIKISNISKPLYKPFGEAMDANYNSNLNVVMPVVEDLYTTYMLDPLKNDEMIDDFALLKNRNNGSFDFEVDIFDNFGIVRKNEKSKNILEILIKKLKPATSKVYIKYV